MTHREEQSMRRRIKSTHIADSARVAIAVDLRHAVRRTSRSVPLAGPRDNGAVASVPSARHLLRAKDLADARYFEPLTVADLARAAGLSRSQFSAQFKRAFGESPHAYLLTRRLERAAALLRSTDWQVADICFRVGLGSVGSFTTSFRRAYGKTPTGYRSAFPPAAAYAMIPECVLRFYGRPQHRTFEEDAAGAA
jgi:AraC-like DNA-binding protein